MQGTTRPSVVGFWAVLITALVCPAGPSRGQTPAATPPLAVPADRQASNVAVVTIKGEINEVTARSVERRIKLAERAGADAIVFEIDTPGGSLGATLGDPALMTLKGIAPLIKGAHVKNTIAWVNPHAYSAGAIIALSCHDIVTTDAAAMGDAIPIAVSMAGIQPLGEAERQKLLAPILSDLVDSARRNHRDEMLVQGVAATGVELWWIERVSDGRQMAVTADEYRTLFGEDPPRPRPRLFSPPSGAVRALAPPMTQEQIDAAKPAAGRRTSALPKVAADDPVKFTPAAPGLAAVSDRVSMEQTLAATRPVIDASQRGQWRLVDYISNGEGPYIFTAPDMLHYGLASGVVRNDQELMRYLGARHLLRLDQNWSEGLVAFLSNIIVRAVLIVIFLIALFLEMTHPGVGVPGGVAAVALIALLAPPMLIDLANWWEIAAIAGGLLLIMLEVFVIPGFGVLGVAGVLALFGGLIGTFVPGDGVFPDTPGAQDDLLYGVVTLGLSTATACVGIYFIAKHLGSIPLISSLVLKESGPGDDDEGMLAAMAPESAENAVRVGMRGRAVTPLRPAGRVEVADRIVDAVAQMGYIPAGAAVVVTDVTGFRVTVEQAGAA
ncbi:MAG: hypothetical protein IT437_02225 [Phycisphaerales bacterium]|nr:hypothetical protein [Phycisphaerales bacterium]